LLVACLPSTGDRGLQQELAISQREAALERQRVHELEARLTLLEERSEAQAPVAPPPSDPMLKQQLDVLIAMNQQLLDETRASQRPATVVPTQMPQVQTVAPRTAAIGPECNAGLTTEQKVLELVLQLRGERSPWRVDGLSYEESQALRVLLRAERELDHENPWQ